MSWPEHTVASCARLLSNDWSEIRTCDLKVKSLILYHQQPRVPIRASSCIINQSINQTYIAPYVASESEARDGGARRSVHIHCKQCQTVLSLKLA